MLRFSRTVSRPNTRRPFRHLHQAERHQVVRRHRRHVPPVQRHPAAGASVRRPQIAFSVVVLPAPLAPTMAQIVPSATASDTPRSARMLP